MRILIAEDEKSLNRILVRQFEKLGYGVDSCFDGEEIFDYLSGADYDAVILDIMMPKRDGFEVLQKMRHEKNNTPVLFLSAKGDVDDKVFGLDCGANDYLVKPFEFKELAARVRAMIRKASGNTTNILELGGLCVDTMAHTVTRDGKNIELSSKEFAILEVMIRNAGHVLSREKIENSVWNYDYSGGTNVIDVYIRYLRKKIDENYETKLIHTVRGVGYVLKDTQTEGKA